MRILNLIFAITLLSFTFCLANTSPYSSKIIFNNGNEPNSSFYAHYKNDQVILSWNNNINNSYFEIEYSENGKDFEVLASMAEENIMKEGDVFYFIDKNPKIETYYRLMQINAEGDITYSEIKHASPLPPELTLEGLK